MTPPLSRTLSAWLQGVTWLASGLAVIAAFQALEARSALDRLGARPESAFEVGRAIDDLISSDDSMQNLGRAASSIWFLSFILLLVWMNQAHKASQTGLIGERTWTGGWTVGGWFIPVANLAIPRLVMSEIEKLSLEREPEAKLASDWRKRRTEVVGWLWWLGLIGGIVVQVVAGNVGDPNDPDVTPASLENHYYLRSLGFAVWAASGASGALYFRRLTNRLSPVDSGDADDGWSATGGKATDSQGFGRQTQQLPNGISEVEVGYSTASWDSDELRQIKANLGERGVRHWMEEGELFVNKTAEAVADKVIAEITGTWPAPKQTE